MKVFANARILQTHTYTRTENKWLWCLLMEHDKRRKYVKINS